MGNEMEKRSITSYKDKKIYAIIIVIFSILCALIGYFCYSYYRKLQNTVKEESRGYMQEISSQMRTNVNKSIDEKYAVLETIVAIIGNLQIDSYSKLYPVMEEHQILWNFQRLLFIDKNGVTYDEKGNTAALGNDAYLQDVIMNKVKSLSTSQLVDGKESIIFAAPVEGIRMNGNNIYAVAMSYDLSTLDQNLNMTAFEGKGYVHMIRSDGSVLIRSSSKNARKTGYNILNSLSEAKFYDNQDLAFIKKEIRSRKSGHIDFTLEGLHEYMTYMPIGDQGWSILTFVPVEVVNAKSNILLRITLLMCGFITIVFASLLGLLMFISYHNKSRLEQIAYVDRVTGGNTIERFYELSKNLLHDSNTSQYALVYSNIEKFKVLNEEFGRNACNEILCSLENGICSDLSKEECCGRLFADNFCILTRYTNVSDLLTRFKKWEENSAKYIETKGMVHLPLILEFGVYVIDNPYMPFPQMIDRAKLSMGSSSVELHGKIRYAIYDEKIRCRLFRDKQLEDRMEEALENHEFQVYLQPKYLVETESIGGAEALVRWNSASEGLIFPDEFIPLFEKNGFIIPLDFYIFEEVCKTIRKWLNSGFQPVKISVNCSRLHLKDDKFIEKYTSISNKYQIPHDLLEIELTENVVFEDVENLTDIIKGIHNAGFGCSMDDFGSGYSSLNLIQDIPVDTLKIDKIFFHNTRDLQRSESVVRSIITMAEALSMATVAEGVEVREQVDMLKRLGCNYIQGYFFAKPMPIADFEILSFGKVIEEING